MLTTDATHISQIIDNAEHHLGSDTEEYHAEMDRAAETLIVCAYTRTIPSDEWDALTERWHRIWQDPSNKRWYS